MKEQIFLEVQRLFSRVQTKWLQGLAIMKLLLGFEDYLLCDPLKSANKFLFSGVRHLSQSQTVTSLGDVF